MPRKNQYVFKKKFESFTLSLDVRILGSISKHKNGILKIFQMKVYVMSIINVKL